MGGSEQRLLDLVKFCRDLYCKGDEELSKKWPETSFQLENTLRYVGYTKPVTSYVCFHDGTWAMSDENQCETCNKTDLIPLHYCELSEKIKKWCSSKQYCEKLTYFYRKEREHWLRSNVTKPWFPIKEMWDGTRFAEMSWFWDPQAKWLLPMFCTNCRGTYICSICINIS